MSEQLTGINPVRCTAVVVVWSPCIFAGEFDHFVVDIEKKVNSKRPSQQTQTKEKRQASKS